MPQDPGVKQHTQHKRNRTAPAGFAINLKHSLPEFKTYEILNVQVKNALLPALFSASNCHFYILN